MITHRQFAGWLALIALSLVSRSHAGEPARNNFVYEIFVRAFADGDDDAKHIGDLKGIVRKLDSYLNDGDPQTDRDLEVGVLWLMPVFPSPSYHGYDVTDYRGINPEYGTIDDFKVLIKNAHQRGVRIMLDIPFNHTSDEHPWFKECIADSKSPKRKFYQVKSGTVTDQGWHPITGPGGEKLSYFGLFSPRMPDLDFTNEDVRKEIESIAKYWLDLGVDGFRLDAAKHIFGDTFGKLSDDQIRRNNQWWRDFSFSVYRDDRAALLVGEVLGDRETMRRHAWGLDGLLDEPFMNELRDQVSRPGAGFLGRQKSYLDAARTLNRAAYQPPEPFPDQPFESYYFVGSHDRSPRLATDLEDRKSQGMPGGIDAACRVAAYTLLLLGSHPVIYAGDELMQRGRRLGDSDASLREPFPWFRSGEGPGQTKWMRPQFDRPNDGVSVEEEDRSGTVFDLIRGLANLRTRHAVLADGALGAIVSDTNDWLVFERTSRSDRYLVLINQSRNGYNYEFRENWFPEYIKAQRIFWSDGKSKQWKDVTTDAARIDRSAFVPPFGLVVLRKL